jgi:hypothetical protein
MKFFQKLLSNRLAQMVGGGVGAFLAAIGGLTTIDALQPAIERTSDYAARTVRLYCELPPVDRARFGDEVNERLTGARVTVTCPQD